jgi:hypothetical protein
LPWVAGDPAAAQAAEQRCWEWFLLERESEVLGAVPSEVFGLEADDEILEGSRAGAFTIDRVGGGSALARDLQDGRLHDLRLDGLRLMPGDMLVGRLFASEDGLMASPAAAVFRPGASLAQAFLRDLQRVDLAQRLSQLELEQLLVVRAAQAVAVAVDRPSGRPLEHLEAELETLLGAGGPGWSAADVSRELAASDRPGRVIGPLLDQLAFGTEVDLDAVRRCLLEIWNAHQAGAQATPAAVEPGPPAGDGETLGQRLVRTLDEGLARHQDVEELFEQLERMAGIEDGEEEDEEEEEPAAAVLGDLEPLLEEYLWECGEAVAADGPTLRLWLQLQQNAAVPRTDLEQITGLDLMRVLLHVYLSARPGSRSNDVRKCFEVLQRFYVWAEDTQGYDLRAALDGCRGALLDHLDRLQAVGQQLSRSESASGAEAPCLMHVEEIGSGGFGVRLDAGDAIWIEAQVPVASLLRPGDLVLGSIERRGAGGRLSGLVVVLPPDAASLVG